ncbi:helix-turn-helix domain-containing protein [Streptomyces ziwulingensis]|uniref:Helix-turn-helix domain-containing protein n=1 Tax=Streptomyces ziwulingensis TaxID=1045501 RepID=A0ABP9BFG2_9ACTN
MIDQTGGTDWKPIVAMCEAVTRDLSRLVPGMVDVIRAEVPEYDVVPRRAHEEGVAEQYRGLLAGLAQRRGPTVEEQEVARELGRRRAEQGLPAQAMISAYHIGYKEMWNVLLSRAGGSDGQSAADLVWLVGMVWDWVQKSSGIAAAAHQDAVRAEDAAESRTTHRFLSALYASGGDRSELAPLARAAGFEPAEEFTALCAPARGWNDKDMIVLRRRFASARGNVRCVNLGTTLTVLSQRVAPAVLVDVMRETGATCPVGVGLTRQGLDGAAASLTDADEALGLAAGADEVVWFRDQWILASVSGHATRLEPLLRVGRDVVRRHPELAETVAVFARSGFSMSATGRQLHLHANSVKYRLGKWRQLTGWDVYTWEGVGASMVALSLPHPARAGTGTPAPGEG